MIADIVERLAMEAPCTALSRDAKYAIESLRARLAEAERRSESNADHARLANRNHDNMARALKAAESRAAALEAELGKVKASFAANINEMSQRFRAVNVQRAVEMMDKAEKDRAAALAEEVGRLTRERDEADEKAAVSVEDYQALEAELAKAREALTKIAAWGTVAGIHEQDRDGKLRDIARAALPPKPEEPTP